jgi:site-specific recombinase XerD
MTVDRYVPPFLRHHQVEANTKDTCEGTLRLHVVPFIGKVRLAEMDRTIARNYMTALQEEGRSANTIRQCKVALAALFGMAVADGYIDINPFHDLKTPKVPGNRAIKIATHDQYLRVRTKLPNKPCKVFSTLMMSSGMRLCEAIALRPSDFDFDRYTVEIAQSVVKVSRKNHPHTALPAAQIQDATHG